MSPFTIFLIAFLAVFIALLIPCLIWYIPWRKKKKTEEKQKQEDENLRQTGNQQILEAMQEKYGVSLSLPAALDLCLPEESKRNKLEAFVKQIRELSPCLLGDVEKWEKAPHVTAEQINPFALFTLFRNGDKLILMKGSADIVGFFSDLKKAHAMLPEFENALTAEKENEETSCVVKQSPSEKSSIDSAIIKYWSEFPFLQTANVRLLSVDDVAYFTSAVTSEKTNTYTTYNNTTVIRTDAKRTATLYFNFNCNLQPLQIKDGYFDDKVSRLEAMLPEKRK